MQYLLTATRAARSLLTTAATGWLLVVCSLIGWSLAPLLIGWRPSVVISGSMAPRIDTGDVVLVAPLTEPPRRGQVLLLREPLAPTGQVLHRVVRVDADGRLRTKGDANPSVDSDLHSPQDVLGMARLVVPAAGRLAVWRQGESTSGTHWWVALTVVSTVIHLGSRLRHR